VERHPIETEEARRFIREIAGREIRELPKLAVRTLGPALLHALAVAGSLRQVIVLAEMFHELQGFVAGHLSLIQSRRFLLRPINGARRIGPPSTSCRLQRGY
jgi:hypothetical protein